MCVLAFGMVLNSYSSPHVLQALVDITLISIENAEEHNIFSKKILWKIIFSLETLVDYKISKSKSYGI